MTKHYAKFYGNVVEVYYEFDRDFIQPKQRTVAHELIWEGSIEQPLLEKGEIIKLPNLDKEITIIKRVRDLGEECFSYYTKYTISSSENEQSKIEAKKGKEAYEKYVEESEKFHNEFSQALDKERERLANERNRKNWISRLLG